MFRHFGSDFIEARTFLPSETLFSPLSSSASQKNQETCPVFTNEKRKLSSFPLKKKKTKTYLLPAAATSVDVADMEAAK